jgi:Zn-dependent protease
MVFKTYELGRVLGVDLRVHGSVLALVALLAGLTLLGQGVAAAAATLVLVATLVVSVTLHELGHIFMARLFGNQTSGITLYPFGGVASLLRPSRSGTEETLVALAGPAVNVAIASVTALPLFALGPLLGPLAPVLQELLWVNVGLALFNLVPAYPMDGGRVLRGLLWSWVGDARATWLAARAGQGFAAVFAVLGLVSNPMLLVIAAFVFLHASAELRRLRALGVQGAFAPRPERFDRAAAPFFADADEAQGEYGANRPRAWSTAAPTRVVTVHTPWGSYREVVLSDGRRVRAS